jgi:hypothetical protein
MMPPNEERYHGSEHALELLAGLRCVIARGKSKLSPPEQASPFIVMKKTTAAGLTTLVVTGFLLIVAFQRHELRTLQERNSIFEKKIQELQSTSERTEPVKSYKLNPDDSIQLRTANLEVQRLRDELSLLKGEIGVLKDKIATATQTDEERKAKIAQEDYTRLRNTYDNLSSLSRGDLRRALVTDMFRDEQMEICERDLAKAERQYSKASAEFGSNHPEVLRLAETVSDIEQKIDAELDRILPSIAATLVQMKERLR